MSAVSFFFMDRIITGCHCIATFSASHVLFEITFKNFVQTSVRWIQCNSQSVNKQSTKKPNNQTTDKPKSSSLGLSVVWLFGLLVDRLQTEWLLHWIHLTDAWTRFLKAIFARTNRVQHSSDRTW